MDGGRKKRVGVKRWSKVDYVSNLPESLLCKVLLNLPTKDVVRTSVLSKRWRNLWRYVPGLDLDSRVFPDHKTFDSFVDAFLGFNSESYLESFKLDYDWCDDRDRFDGDTYNYKPENDIVKRWINTVVDRRVKHLTVLDNSFWECDIWDVRMPPTLYTCESLVSLKLYGVELASPMSVSLPCLKFMDLCMIQVSLDLDLETLISGCPVLESLFIETSFNDGIQVIRVCSQSLLRFTHIFGGYRNSVEDDFVVDIYAPRLQYLRLGDDCIGSLILNNTGSLVEAYIDTVFNWSFNFKNDLQKRKMIGSFLEGISCVKDVTITSKTLEVIYHYSKCQQLPLFRNLFFLRVSFPKFKWKMLPVFLESCPNLKSIVLASERFPLCEAPELGILSGPRCLLSSLEYVDIEIPLTTMEMELVRYFLENSVTLKKLTVRLAASTKDSLLFDINLKELLAVPRRSSCQVIVL